MTTPSASSPSGRVGQIFVSAGAAFNQLGELTSELSSSQAVSSSGGGQKWTEEEMEMLHSAVSDFADRLAEISLRIKGRMVGQIKTTLRKKAYEEAGIPMPSATPASAANAEPTAAPVDASPQPTAPVAASGSAVASNDVTLNALNATNENEVDVEGLGANESGLAFDSGEGAAANM